MLKSLVVVAALGVLPVHAQDRVINLPGSPVEIVDLQTQYLPSGGGGEGPTFVFRPDVRNVSDLEVLAYSVVFMAIDAVGDTVSTPQNVLNLYALAPSAERKDPWSLSGPSVGKLERYGAGVAYVRAVRLSDGTLWRATDIDIAAAIAEFEK